MAALNVESTLREPTPGYLTPLLVDEREAARLLSLSARKVAYMADEGRLRVVRIDGSKRYEVENLRDFVQSLREQGEQLP